MADNKVVVSDDAVVGLIRRRPVLFLLALTAAVSLPLIIFPQIDLAVSRLFYVQEQGFAGSKIAFLQVVREFGQDVLRVSGLLIVVSIVFQLLVNRVSFLLPPRAALFLLTSLVLGPGLLVNALLKEIWGRARPRSVMEFGGDLPFSRAWELVNYCDSNCSFVSGEASSAIWFMAFAMIVPVAWRLKAAVFAFGFAAVMSLNRIVFGGHFLSDVLISWTLTLTVIVMCYNVFYKSSAVTDERVEAWFSYVREKTRAGWRRVF